jgi:four helix bundle protein
LGWGKHQARRAIGRQVEGAKGAALEVYTKTESWPVTERYGLTAQIRRAALSVPTNIAEGVGRQGRRELARYLSISLGSLAELSYLLRFSRDREICSRQDWAYLERLRGKAGGLVYGLYRRVRFPERTSS